MKKLIAIMLCCMMMVGALSAFAEDGVMPCGDCNHSYGTYSVSVSEWIDSCTKVSYKEVYCAECDEYLRTTNTKYTYSHDWRATDDVHDGKTVYVCADCGEEKW